MDDFELSLKPEEQPSELDQLNAQLNLGTLIQRIAQERGSFVSTTEEALLDEIQRQSVKVEEDIKETDNEEAAESVNDSAPDSETPVDLEKAQAELRELVSRAQNESALSLDFVSLLLSCLRPAAGTTSMSPYLKQHVPVGTLAADALWVNVPEEDQLVGAGWKLQSLSRASGMLQSAAQRLAGQAVAEATYWKSIFDVAQEGEVLFKIKKGETRGLAVKYGFGDAGSNYKDRGIAIVKRGPEGEVQFRFDLAKRRQIVRVTLYRIQADGKRKRTAVSNMSIFSEADPAKNEDPVLESIRRARAYIFEEELFYELVREARTMLSYNVSIVDSKITISMRDEMLEIDHLVGADWSEAGDAVKQDAVRQDADGDVEMAEENNERQEDEEDASEEKDQTRANLILSILRLLLCHSFANNLANKQSIPAPMSTRQAVANRTPPPLFILRPLVAHLAHHKVVQRTRRLLDMLTRGWGNEMEVDSGGSPKASDSSPLKRLLDPPTARFRFGAENGARITVTTSSPLLAHLPLYRVLAERDGRSLSQTAFYELHELETWVQWVAKL